MKFVTLCLLLTVPALGAPIPQSHLKLLAELGLPLYHLTGAVERHDSSGVNFYADGRREYTIRYSLPFHSLRASVSVVCSNKIPPVPAHDRKAVGEQTIEVGTLGKLKIFNYGPPDRLFYSSKTEWVRRDKCFVQIIVDQEKVDPSEWSQTLSSLKEIPAVPAKATAQADWQKAVGPVVWELAGAKVDFTGYSLAEGFGNLWLTEYSSPPKVQLCCWQGLKTNLSAESDYEESVLHKKDAKIGKHTVIAVDAKRQTTGQLESSTEYGKPSKQSQLRLFGPLPLQKFLPLLSRLRPVSPQ